MPPTITETIPKQGSLTERTVSAARQLIAGQRGGARAYLAFAGPAVIVSIAYMDPGNFATNIQAGAKYGYELLWVVLLANVIAMLFQALSAKLGIVTGRNLAEMCREHFPRPVVLAMWVVSEVAAMATDLHQVPRRCHRALSTVPDAAPRRDGGHGDCDLRHIDVRRLWVPTDRADHRQPGWHHWPVLLVQMFIVPVDWASAAVHSVVPQLTDAGALVLTVGIIGATVMPHAIYLHSGLTQLRHRAATRIERRKVIRFSNQEVIIALALARPGEYGDGDDGVRRLSCGPQ